MTEQRKQHITLQLDAHHISLNVPADKEHLYRKAAEKGDEDAAKALKELEGK